MGFLSAAVGVKRSRRPAWSERSTRPPDADDGNIARQRPGANMVVCCQQREDWYLGLGAAIHLRLEATPCAKCRACPSPSRQRPSQPLDQLNDHMICATHRSELRS